MANVRTDKIVMEVELNGKPVTNTLTDIRKRYQQLGREIKELEIGSDEFIKKQGEMAALKKILDDNRKATQAYGQALDDVAIQRIGNLSARVGVLRKEIKGLEEGTEEYAQKSAEIKTAEDALKRVQQEALEAAAATKKLSELSLNDLNQQAKDLRQEINKLPPSSERLKEALLELGEVEGEIENLSGAMNKVKTSGDASASGIKKAFGSVGAFLKTNIVGFIIGIVASISGVISSLRDAQGEITDIRQEANLLFGATGDELNNIAADIQSTANTFGVEWDQTLRAAQVTTRAFGLDAQDSLALIQDGLEITQDQGDEFLEQIKEYGPQLRAAGLSAQESFALVAQGIQQGAFTDKLPDAIKEFNLRIKDLSVSQRQILEDNLGVEFTNRIINGIETGKLTSIEALKSISSELGGLGADSAATQKVISNLFGGPGEDLGADFIISLQNAATATSDLIDESNIYTQQRREQLALEERNSQALARLSEQLDGTGSTFRSIWLTIKATFLEGLVTLIDTIIYFPDVAKINFAKAKVAIVNFANGAIRAINEFTPLLVGINKAAEFLGSDFRIEIPTISIDQDEPVRLQQELQAKIEADRSAFAEEQKRKATESALATAKAEGDARSKGLNDNLKRQIEENAKRADELAKARQEAQNKITELEIAAMQEGTARTIAELERKSQLEIQAVTGTAAQRAQQEILIRQRLERQKDALAKEELAKRIASIKIQGAAEIGALEGSSSDIAAKKKEVEERVTKEIIALRQQVSEDIQRRINEQQAIQIDIAAKANIDTSGISSESEGREQSAISIQTQDETEIVKSNLQAIEAAQNESYQRQLERLEQVYALRRVQIVQQLQQEIEDGKVATEDIDEVLQERILENARLYNEEKRDIQESFGRDEIQLAQEIEDAKLEAVKRRLEEEAQAEEDKRERDALFLEEFNNQAGALTSSLTNLDNAIFANRMEKLNQQQELELSRVGDSAEKREEIEAKFDKQREALEKKREKSRKATALANKAISITNTIINTKESIVKTGADLGYPQAIPFQALAATVGALNVAAIIAQKFENGGKLPTLNPNPIYKRRFESGGVTPSGGGVTKGPRHSQGGIKLVNNGRIVGEVEGGEPILSRKTYANNREVVDRLLRASQYEGGRRILYQQGGILSAPNTTPSLRNVSESISFSDDRIVRELQNVQAAISAIDLVIGEQRASDIVGLNNTYQQSIQGTDL